MRKRLCVFVSGFPWVPQTNKSQSYWSSFGYNPHALPIIHVRIGSYSLFYERASELSIISGPQTYLQKLDLWIKFDLNIYTQTKHKHEILLM